MAARSAALRILQAEVLLKSLSSPCGERAGIFWAKLVTVLQGFVSSCRRSTGRVGELTCLSSLASSGTRPLRVMVVTSPDPSRIPKKGQCKSKEQLWREFFSDPSQWWDDRFDKVRTLCKTGHLRAALQILNREGIMPDSNTYVCLLRECMKIENLKMGKQVHAHIIQSGFKPNIFLLNVLVNMYAKCRSMVDARLVFNKMSERDVFTWTIMMAGYSQNGYDMEAFDIYQLMVQAGAMPDRVSFVCILNVCANLAVLEKGKEVHADIMKAGILLDIVLETALVDMYAKCGSINDACDVFNNMARQNVISWSAMIAGYAQYGCGRKAFEIYGKMMQEGVTPNRVTFISVLKACASLVALDKGKEIHSDIIKAGIVPDMILANTLIDMYAKCGSLVDARLVFDKMAKRDVVSWSVMIAGYTQHACGMEAFQMYERMIQEGVTPNKVTFICVFDACASLAALKKGKAVHSDSIKAGIASDINLENALVNMYAKCGSVKDARQVFDNMAERDLVSWSAMIAGYGQHGYGREALQLFEQMQHEGLKPDNISFISVLSACSHVGLVVEGSHYFDSMSRVHGLTPRGEHFCCMVDLLSRAGRLDEAEDFITKIPIEPCAVARTSVLGACRIHGNVEVAESVAKCLLNLDP